MNPRTAFIVSIITLVVSVGTLGVVWGVQQDLAHGDAEAAGTGTTADACSRLGGHWKTGGTYGGLNVGQCDWGDGTSTISRPDGSVIGTVDNSKIN